MEELNQALVHRLRTLARQGHTLSQMLREVIRELAPATPHKVTLIKYMRAAFGLTLQQASPIAGWAADGSGELKDKQVDDFIGPEIARNRTTWDSLDLAS